MKPSTAQRDRVVREVIRFKRIYKPAAPEDGYRLLVDRLWPRGISHRRSALDGWEPDLAPTDELRQWFGHALDRFDEFARRYRSVGRAPHGCARSTAGW